MRPDQLGDYAIPSDPRMHPDGARVAFVVTRMDLEEDRYVRRIHLWDGERARPLTAGPRDSAPRWSPDGAYLAFIRQGDDEEAKAQVARLDLSGGEAELVTDFELGVTEVEWAPDGARLAVVAAEWHPDLAGLDADERTRRPRRVTRFPYRFDDMGWLHERQMHIHLVDLSSGDATRLTSGEFDETGIAWHPSGERIGFRSARHESRGLDPGSQIWEVSVDGGEPVPLTGIGTWGHISYDPAGRAHVCGSPDRWGHPDTMPLWRVEDDGSLTDRTGVLDRNVIPGSPPVSPPGPQWLEDGSAVTVLEDEGKLRVIEIGSDGGFRDIIDGHRVVTGVSPRPDGSALALVAGSATDPGELWWWEGGEERRLTDLNGAFRASADLVAPQRFTIGHDGVEVEGWVYLPPGAGKVPVLLNIHGGPAAAYGYGFFDEFQVYCGAGYGVVAINPRGSSGYGSAHVRAVLGTWQGDDPPDLRDLHAAVDVAVAAYPRLDSERVGIMGGSYGGLATARIIAETGRFRSAVAERGLYTFASFMGTSDIGPWFTRLYLGDDRDDPSILWGAGPLAKADRINTPTLLLHSEADYRCPIEQAEQMFVRLLRNGTTTELVRFPAPEGHELSRRGKPKHRRERFEIILDWHGRYLK